MIKQTLSADLASALLRDKHQRLIAARDELCAAIVAANWDLSTNPLTNLAAGHAAREQGLSGQATISVDAAGYVKLEVDSGEEGPPPMVMPSVVAPIPVVVPLPVAAPDSKAKLPSISELRQEARQLGIDPAIYGKAKRKLLDAIAAVRGGASPPKPVVVPQPTPQPIPPPIPKPAVPEPTPDPKPPESKLDIDLFGDDDDVTDLFRQLDGKPPTRPDISIPKPSPPPKPPVPLRLPPKPRPTPKRTSTPAVQGTPAVPPKRKGRSLSAIASGADAEIDIDAILAKPTPEIPKDDQPPR